MSDANAPIGSSSLDHIGIAVTNYAASKDFYVKALAPLGLELVKEVTPEMSGDGSRAAGFGANGRPFFWIGTGPAPSRVHVALTAPSRGVVDKFYTNGLAVGGRDNGAPGVRAYYHPNYYGAFILDPDGHNIEAVCHLPPV
jgi:catechol 2,3-dioxygenase-like lactoylglutathione lyase family enzyme